MKSSALLLSSFLLFTRLIYARYISDPLNEIENEVREIIDTVESAEEETRERRVESAIKFGTQHGFYINHTDARVEEIAEEIADGDMDEDRVHLSQGDIILSKHDNGQEKKSAESSKRWPGGIIYYEISYVFRIGSNQRRRILEAMQLISSKSCLTFKERTTETNWVLFISSSGCSSSVGMEHWGQPQEIRLHSNCFLNDGTVLHEILHTAGFWHEQSRPDRDNYVRIHLDHVTPQYRHNFDKAEHTSILGRNYDYGSVMHYPSNAFTVHPWYQTIEPYGVPSDITIGQRDGLSGGDIIDINLLYDCKGQTTYVGDWTNFGPCTDQCTKSRQRFCGDEIQCPDADVRGMETETVQCGQECNPGSLIAVCPLEGYGISGHDVTGNVEATTWELCAAKCFAHDNCNFWTFTSLPRSTECYLKADKSSLTEMKGKISGSKSCGTPAGTTGTLWWYCGVSQVNGIITTSTDLQTVQNGLGHGNYANKQGIIPMYGREAGDPHLLEKDWGTGSMWWSNWNDINNMREQCERAEMPLAPQSGNTMLWYCGVSLFNGVITKSTVLQRAQNELGHGSPSNTQSIIPMNGRKGGDPHYLVKDWGTGSMWWGNWDDIRNMREQCEEAEMPIPPISS